MIGVDLFAGCGGLSQGAIAAGIDVCAAVERDEHAAKTYKKNHPNTKVFCGSVEAVSAEDLPGRDADEKVLFGGLPCRGFSVVNQRTRGSENPANWLFKEFLRIARHWDPTWIVIENVTGLAETEGGVFLENMNDGLQTLGYHVTVWRLNASSYGVPQDRRRVFLIGYPSSGKAPERPRESSQSVVVRDALRDLPDLSNGASVDVKQYGSAPPSKYARELRNGGKTVTNNLVTRNAPYIINRYGYIPQGSNWRAIPSRLMGNYSDRSRCHTTIYHRLREDKPSVVISNYRKNMLIHPRQNRGLSVREAARLQSFGDDFVFCGSIGFQQQQVANAVPPKLAYAVFGQVSKAHA